MSALTAPIAPAVALFKSALLGLVEAATTDVYTLPAGLPGFAGCRQFAVVASAVPGVAWWQSVERPDVTLCVADPFRLVDDFAVDVPEAVARRIGAASVEELGVYVLVTLPKDPAAPATVNLETPLLVCPARQLACQIIPAEVGNRFHVPVSRERLVGRTT